MNLQRKVDKGVITPSKMVDIINKTTFQSASKIEKVRRFHFDCWKRDGRLRTKSVISVSEKDACLLFEAKYPGFAYDPPYC